MGCGDHETMKHFLQYQVLHTAKMITRDFEGIKKWFQNQQKYPELKIIIEKSLLHWMERGKTIEIWELQDSSYREALEHAIQAQNFIGWLNMLKGRIAQEWGDIQMQYYEELYNDDMPKHLLATWWSSELIRQLLYFGLAIWQHRNNYLHDSIEKAQKIQDRTTAVEEMAQWYERANEFPKEDKINFSHSFLEQCTDTTAQILLWLGKIVDIHNTICKRHSEVILPRVSKSPISNFTHWVL